MRIEAARLREKLREYYGTEGQSDAIHIDLPKGTYAPLIEFREAEQPVKSVFPAIAVLPFVNLSDDPKQDVSSPSADQVLNPSIHRPANPLRRRIDRQLRRKRIGLTSRARAA